MSTNTTTTSAYGWRPDTVAFPPAEAVPNALILSAATVLASVEGDAVHVDVPFVKDAWTAAVVAEGAPITDSEPTLAQVQLTTAKYARLVAVSREQFNKPHTAPEIANSVGRDLTSALDSAFITALASNAGVVTAGSSISANLDPLVDLLATLETNGADQDDMVILLSPDVWSYFRKLKVATGWNANLLGSGVHDQQNLLLGIPVKRSRFIGTGKGFVVDRRSVPAAIGPVQVAQSDQYLFNSDSIALRATVRMGFDLIVRTNPDGSSSKRVGKFAVTTGS